MPEKWFTEDYQTKLKKCKVPANLSFKIKQQLAVDIFQELVNEKVLPYNHFVSIPSDIKCWLNLPILREKQYKYKGEIIIKTILEKTQKEQIKVNDLAKNINNFFWDKRSI